MFSTNYTSGHNFPPVRGNFFFSFLPYQLVLPSLLSNGSSKAASHSHPVPRLRTRRHSCTRPKTSSGMVIKHEFYPYWIQRVEVFIMNTVTLYFYLMFTYMTKFFIRSWDGGLYTDSTLCWSTYETRFDCQLEQEMFLFL